MTDLIQVHAGVRATAARRPLVDSDERLWVSVLDLEQTVGAIVDADFRLVSFTPAFRRYFAALSGDLPEVGADARAFECQTVSQLCWSERWSQALAGDILKGVDEVEIDGPVSRHWRTQMQPLRDERGEIYAAVLSARDITQEVRDLQSLAVARSELQQVRRHETIGQLATSVANDLSNMLSVVGGSLELLGKETTVDQNLRVRRHVALTFEALGRAASITRRLLSLGRKHESVSARVDVQDLLAGMVEIIEATVDDLTLVEWQIEPGLWHVRTAPIELENALLNLVLNARDAMPGGGDLIIRAENWRQPAGEEYVMISVSDTGCGISPDLLTQIFDPFFTTKGAGKRAGLGLSSVEDFVRGIGGHVAVDSAENVGSIFRIMLPHDAC